MDVRFSSAARAGVFWIDAMVALAYGVCWKWYYNILLVCMQAQAMPLLVAFSSIATASVSSHLPCTADHTMLGITPSIPS